MCNTAIMIRREFKTRASGCWQVVAALNWVFREHNFCRMLRQKNCLRSAGNEVLEAVERAKAG